MWHVKDVGDVILIVFVCNAIYDEDVKDGKRTYRHIFIITFLIWYHLNVMLSMLKMSKIWITDFTDVYAIDLVGV